MCLTIQKRTITKQEVFLMAEIAWPICFACASIVVSCSGVAGLPHWHKLKPLPLGPADLHLAWVAKGMPQPSAASLACPIHSKSQAAASGQRATLNEYMPSSNLRQAGNLPSSASCSASVKQPELLMGSHVSSPPGCGQFFAVFDFRAVHPNLLREASKAKIIRGFGSLAPHLSSCCLVS